MAKAYSWSTPGQSGLWSDAANWTDLATGKPATSPPGANDTATVGGGTDRQFQILGGPGAAAALTFHGDTALAGTIDAGTLTLGSVAPKGAYSIFDAVDVLAGANLAVSGTATLFQNLQVDGAGAGFTAGTVQQGGATVASEVLVLNGATASAGSWTLNGGDLYVDPTAMVEIGTAGGAGKGVVTIDQSATLTVSGGSSVGVGVVDNGTLAALAAPGIPEPTIAGDVSGSGTLVVGKGALLSVQGSLSGLRRVTVDARGILSAGGGSKLGPVGVGKHGSIDFGGSVTRVKSVNLGASAGAVFGANLSGSGKLTAGASATVEIDGTLSGLSGVSLATGAVLTFGTTGVNVPARDVNVPITLAGTNELNLATGVTIEGAVSGFDTSDVIVNTAVGFGLGGVIITAAVLAGGTLTLSSDGHAQDAITLAGNYAGQQFLTNIAELNDGLSEVTLAVGTIDGLGGSGTVTVTGASSVFFDVLAGSGTASSLALVGNNAVDGRFTAGTIGVGGTIANTLNVTDIEAGGTLHATAAALIVTGVEVDGAGAALLVDGTLSMGSGYPESELYVVNGGTLRATDVVIAGGVASPGIYEGLLALDATAFGEIGGLGRFAGAGILGIDAGATLAAGGLNIQVSAPTIDDNGLILVEPPLLSGVFVSSLYLVGSITGNGTITLDKGTSLFVTGSVTGLAAINDATGTSLAISGSLDSSLALVTGASSSTTIEGSITGLSRLEVGGSAFFEAGASVAKVGPIAVDGSARLEILGNLSGSAAMTVSSLASVSIFGTVSGLSGITLASQASLYLYGRDTNVPISLGGSDLLAVAAGVTISGAVSHFDSSDAIQNISTLFETGGAIITGATLTTVGGQQTLALTDDGATIDLITLAGSFAGATFLVNSAGIQDGYTDVTLPGASRSGLGGGGAVTVTGLTGGSFELVDGSGSATSATFTDNNAIAGQFSLGSFTAATGASSLTTVNATDIIAGGALTVSGAGRIEAAMQVDGAGAALRDSGTLSLGGGAPEAQLLVLDGGLVTAAALLLTGSNAQVQPVHGAQLLVDPRGSVSIGGLAAGAGTIAIAAGATLEGQALNASIVATTIVDDGALVVGDPAYPGSVAVSSMQVQGSITGSGVITVGDHALTTGAVSDLSAITVGSGSLVVSGPVTSVGTITTGANSGVTLDGGLSGGNGITEGSNANLTIVGTVSGGGSIAIGVGAHATIDGTVLGLKQITLGAGATLVLSGADRDVPIVMGANSTLEIDPGTPIGGVISGFGPGNLLEITGASAGTIVTGASLTGASLVLSDDGAALNTLTLGGSYAGLTFLTNAAGQGGVSNVVVAGSLPHG